MAINTYALLKTAVANRLHRANDAELALIIPEFINYAESVIGGDPEPTDMEVLPGIRTKNQHKRVTTATTTQYLDIPTDLLAIKDIQINISPIQSLDFLSPKVMTAKYPSTPAGTPKAYTIHGDEFQFSHVPDSSLTLEISYLSRYTAFSDDADTNWLLTNHPHAYLYAALVAGASHIDEDPSKYASLYKSIANGINAAERNGTYGANLSARPETATP